MKKIFFILFISCLMHTAKLLSATGLITHQPEQQSMARSVTCMDRVRSCELKCLCCSCMSSTCATAALGAATLCSPTNTLPLFGGTVGSTAVTVALAVVLCKRGCETIDCSRFNFLGR